MQRRISHLLAIFMVTLLPACVILSCGGPKVAERSKTDDNALSPQVANAPVDAAPLSPAPPSTTRQADVDKGRSRDRSSESLSKSNRSGGEYKGAYGATGYAQPHQLPREQEGVVLDHQRRAQVDSTAAFNTENYSRIYENEFLDVAKNPLSTFSIDVDAASYSNVRRYLNAGSLPPRDAVRIEEFINYFTYDYPQPKKGEPFSITTDVAVCPWDKAHRIVQIGLQGRRIAMEDLPPNNLVFLIDVSGSMSSPDKLPLLQSAFRLLVKELRDRDKVSIVVYAGAAGLVLPTTGGSEKGKILDAIDRLQAGGSTAGGAGIELAYKVAKDEFIEGGNNRVILATDGDFNVGVSSEGELVRLIEKKRESGVFLSVLGFGTGNLQDAKMEQLADKGNGHYAYIDDINEARKVFVNELGATLLTIAKDVKIQIEFNPAQVEGYRLIGYENRMLRAEDFNNDKKDAGELGAGHSVTAIYEVIPAGTNYQYASIDPLKYQGSAISPVALSSRELMTVKLRYKPPQEDVSKLITGVVGSEVRAIDNVSENLRFATAVAQWGLLLRESKFKGTSTFDDVIALATGAKGADPHGMRAEFISLVQKSKGMRR